MTVASRVESEHNRARLYSPAMAKSLPNRRDQSSRGAKQSPTVIVRPTPSTIARDVQLRGNISLFMARFQQRGEGASDDSLEKEKMTRALPWRAAAWNPPREPEGVVDQACRVVDHHLAQPKKMTAWKVS